MSERRFLIFLWLWLAAHAAIRIAGSPVLGPDDVEQAIFTQSIDWSYGFRQPPLYTWLLAGLYALLGPGLAAHLLLRYALLFLTALALHRIALRLLGDGRLALAAVAGYTLLPLYGFGVHQGFTHTTLQSAVMALTFLAALQLLERPGMGGYLALGLLAGIGVLTKYSYLVFLAGLLLGALAVPAARRRLRDPRLALAAVAAAAVALPVLAMGWRQGYSLTMLAVGTLGGTGTWAARVLAGARALAQAALEYLTPAWLLALAVFPAAVRRRARPAGDGCRWAGLVTLAALGVVAAGMLAGRVVHLEQRWLPPVLFLAPLAFACRARAAGVAPGRVRLWLRICAGFAVAVLVGRVLYFAAGPLWGDWKRLHVPYPAWAAELRALGLEPAVLVADDEHLAGNFRVLFPQARIATPHYAFYLPPPPRRPGPCLLVWRADRSAAPPARLLRFARTRLGIEVETRRRLYLGAPLLWSGPKGPRARLGVLRGRCASAPAGG